LKYQDATHFCISSSPFLNAKRIFAVCIFSKIVTKEMRKTGLFLLLFGIWSGCDKVAEPPLTEQDAPEAVVQAIAGRFDGVSDLTLTTLQSNRWYAADFKSQMVHYKAVLQPEGTFKNLDTEIPVASLPGTAKVYVDNYFPVNSIGFLYQNTDPATAQDIGYFTQITDSTGRYLLSGLREVICL
jgi:hypothetical protein